MLLLCLEDADDDYISNNEQNTLLEGTFQLKNDDIIEDDKFSEFYLHSELTPFYSFSFVTVLNNITIYHLNWKGLYVNLYN